MGFTERNLNTFVKQHGIIIIYKYIVQIFIRIQTLVTQFLQIQVPDMFTLPLTKTLLK
jgi:hypothetical protein